MNWRDEYTLTSAAAIKLAAELLTTRTAPESTDAMLDLGARWVDGSARYRPVDVIAWCHERQSPTIKDALAAKARAEELDGDSNFYRQMTTPEAVSYILHGETGSLSSVTLSERGGPCRERQSPAIKRALAMAAKVDAALVEMTGGSDVDQIIGCWALSIIKAGDDAAGGES